MASLTKSLRYIIKPAPKTYVGLKNILLLKLEAITGQDGDDLFAGIYGVAETEPDGYPCVFVMEQLGKGQIIDTHRNQREWQFQIVIHQEIGTKTPEEAYTALLDAVDRVIATFDEDPQLRDEHEQAQCIYARVVPVEIDYSTEASAVHRALLQIAIVDIVNRYTA